MNAIVIGLKYEPGMNFHELVCHGLSLNQQEKKQLLVELRRRYSDFISMNEESAEIELSTRIRELSNDATFMPLIIPSGNDRFKNVYLFLSSKTHRFPDDKQWQQNDDPIGGQAISIMVFGLLNNEPSHQRFAQQSLSRAVGDDPNCVSQLLLIGAAVLAMTAEQPKRQSPFNLDDAELDEIRNRYLNNRKKPSYSWLPGFRSRRNR